MLPFSSWMVLCNSRRARSVLASRSSRIWAYSLWKPALPCCAWSSACFASTCLESLSTVDLRSLRAPSCSWLFTPWFCNNCSKLCPCANLSDSALFSARAVCTDTSSSCAAASLFAMMSSSSCWALAVPWPFVTTSARSSRSFSARSSAACKSEPSCLYVAISACSCSSLRADACMSSWRSNSRLRAACMSRSNLSARCRSSWDCSLPL
mmetsp:Transcript_39239/g.108069  ORF Transcript_39239/g.108069 Transcript_39239/m.108069 type:complete len:209 (+) Transcript_39239:1174-1800(+)